MLTSQLTYASLFWNVTFSFHYLKWICMLNLFYLFSPTHITKITFKALEWKLIHDVFSVADSTHRNLDRTHSFQHTPGGSYSVPSTPTYLQSCVTRLVESSALAGSVSSFALSPHRLRFMRVVVRTVGWQSGNNVDNARCKFPSCAVRLLRRPLGAPVRGTAVQTGMELAWP